VISRWKLRRWMQPDPKKFSPYSKGDMSEPLISRNNRYARLRPVSVLATFRKLCADHNPTVSSVLPQEFTEMTQVISGTHAL